MKKITLCIFICSMLSKISNAQFGLEQIYDSTEMTKFYYVNFQQNGEKFVKILFPSKTNQIIPFDYEIRIYNLDHSIWKTINLSNIIRPVGTNCCTQYQFLYLSDSLFDGDNLIEFMYCVSRSDTGASSNSYILKWNTYVYNENQVLLFADTTAGPYYSNINIPQTQVPIVNTSSGTKMILATTNGQVKVYGLSGALPTQYNSPRLNETNSNFYPNPSSDHSFISYDLPNGVSRAKIIIYDLNGKKVKLYLIDNTFNNLLVETKDLTDGTYFYIIESDDGKIIQGKKFIKITN